MLHEWMNVCIRLTIITVLIAPIPLITSCFNCHNFIHHSSQIKFKWGYKAKIYRLDEERGLVKQLSGGGGLPWVAVQQ